MISEYETVRSVLRSMFSVQCSTFAWVAGHARAMIFAPTGLRKLAQGCRKHAATLGDRNHHSLPQRGCTNRSHFSDAVVQPRWGRIFLHVTQGSGVRTHHNPGLPSTAPLGQNFEIPNPLDSHFIQCSMFALVAVPATQAFNEHSEAPKVRAIPAWGSAPGKRKIRI